MKRLLISFCIGCMASISYGMDIGFLKMHGGGSESEPYGCATCQTYLRCEDNAENTIVTNSGTGDDWIASVNTSSITSMEKIEGASSFLLNASTNRIYSSDNWTSEKLEITFYMKLVSVDPPISYPNTIVSLGLGAVPTSTNNNTFGLIRNLDNVLNFVMRGFGPDGKSWLSTNWEPDTNWHKYTISIDASTSPWTSVVIKQDGMTITWDISELPTNAATFNYPIYFGVTNNDRPPNAYFDVITVEDKS